MILLAARLSLGVVFAMSGLSKLRSVSAFGAAAADFVRVSRRVAVPAGVVLAGVETGSGALLVAGQWVRLVGAVVVGLLTAFTVLVGWNVARGRRVTCACFGESTAAPVGPRQVIRNLVLLGIAGVMVALAWQPAASGQFGVLTGQPDRADYILAVIVAASGWLCGWLISASVPVWRSTMRLGNNREVVR